MKIFTGLTALFFSFSCVLGVSLAEDDPQPLPGKSLCIVTVKQQAHNGFTEGQLIGKFDVNTPDANEAISMVMRDNSVSNEIKNSGKGFVFYECLSERGVVAKRIPPTEETDSTAKWGVVGYGSDLTQPVILLVNISNIAELGNSIRKAEIKYDFSKYPGGVNELQDKEMRAVAEFDCKDSKIKFLEAMQVDRNGTPYNKQVFSSPTPTTINEGNILLTALNFVCHY